MIKTSFLRNLILVAVILLSACQKYPDYVYRIPSDFAITGKVNGIGTEKLVSDIDRSKLLCIILQKLAGEDRQEGKELEELANDLVYNPDQTGIDIKEPFYFACDTNENFIITFNIRNYQKFDRKMSTFLPFREDDAIKWAESGKKIFAYDRTSFVIYVDFSEKTSSHLHEYIKERFAAGRKNSIANIPGFKDMVRSEVNMNLLLNGILYKDATFEKRLANLPLGIKKNDFNILFGLSFYEEKIMLSGNLFVKNAMVKKTFETIAAQFPGIEGKYMPYVPENSILLAACNIDGEDYLKLFPGKELKGFENIVAGIDGEVTMALNINKEIPAFLPSAYHLSLYCEIDDEEEMTGKLEGMGMKKDAEGFYNMALPQIPFIKIYIKMEDEELILCTKKEMLAKKKALAPVSEEKYRDLWGVVRLNYEPLLNNPIVMVAGQKKLGIDMEKYNPLLKNAEFKIKNISRMECNLNMGTVDGMNYMEILLEILLDALDAEKTVR